MVTQATCIALTSEFLVRNHKISDSELHSSLVLGEELETPGDSMENTLKMTSCYLTNLTKEKMVQCLP